MCGIAGVITKSSLTRQELETKSLKITNTLEHRGPDDCGVWVDENAGVAFGQRRLSILDLSPLGHQPMLSEDKNLVIVYNGEVYNFKEIKDQLIPHGYKFKGGSDTEVILAAIHFWGLEAAVKKFIGMFAFAVYDIKAKKIHLVRDRLGIKPLYYGRLSDGSFLFASELKAIKAWDGFNESLDLKALALYFRHNYIPAPYSIFKSIKKLEPGYILTLDISKNDFYPSLTCYWDVRNIFLEGIKNPWSGSEQEAIEVLNELLEDSVRLRLIADVPLGAFLSGGIDSSTVTSIMQFISNTSVKTFSIGFKEHSYDEAPMAKAVARHLGTDHTELYVTQEDAQCLVPTICHLWDEPFADSSQIPTLLVSKLARSKVTVALSGDGGDELFSGYDRYFNSLAIWDKKRLIPRPIQLFIGSFLNKMSYGGLRFISKTTKNILKKMGATDPGALSVYRISEILKAKNFPLFYGYTNSHWMFPSGLLLMRKDVLADIFYEELNEFKEHYLHLMTFLDLKTYLPDDILVKVDRATMGVALESRVPILDHRIVEFSAKIPTHLRIREGKGKWLLRQVLYKYVPKELVERPKQGFSVPIGEWIKGALKDWAQELISSSRLKREGILRADVIDILWKEHLRGEFNYEHLLWNVLMFESWVDRWYR